MLTEVVSSLIIDCDTIVPQFPSAVFSVVDDGKNYRIFSHTSRYVDFIRWCWGLCVYIYKNRIVTMIVTGK